MIVHDYFQVNGGSERLVLTLMNNLKNFKLLTSGVYKGFNLNYYGELSTIHIESIGCQFPLPRIIKALIAFTVNTQEEANIVIYSGIFSILASARQKAKYKIYYCHTLPKFTYNLTYSRSHLKNFTSIILYPLIKVYWHFYKKSLGNMNCIITNSKNIQSEINKRTGYNSSIIYPPVDHEKFTWISNGDFYLSHGRLESDKQVEKIVRAFIGIPTKYLVVASGGSQENYLKKIAAGSKNIIFTGWLPDWKLTHLIGTCLATIYLPKNEDFGMSAIESLAAGKPVIGSNAGGLREIINPQVGFLISSSFTPLELQQLIMNIDSNTIRAMRTVCELESQKYSKEIFIKSFFKIIYKK